MHRDGLSALSKVGFIFFVFLVRLSDASVSEAASIPDFSSFQHYTISMLIILTIIFLISRLLNQLSEYLIKVKSITFLLNMSIIDYIMIICISTIAFYIIGIGISTNEHWDREFLINTIILCLIVFAVDQLIIRNIQRILFYLNRDSKKCNNAFLFLGSMALIFLLYLNTML